MKTAVEQLFSDLLSGKITDVLINQDKYIQLEKQQIVDAYLNAVQHECDGLDNIETASIKEDAENYYTETYK